MNDQPDEYFRNNAEAAFGWVEKHMPDHVAAALDRFVITNPRQEGIDWWTAMDMLRDADAHLDIIEPLIERIHGWGVLHTYVTLTLLYSIQAFSQEYSEDKRYRLVRATIEG